MTDEELIDYTDPDIIARQNIAPNAGCNIDGKFYDVRNLVHLASSQADRIEQLLQSNEALVQAAKPFADIGVPSDPDYQPTIHLDRDAILALRAALKGDATFPVDGWQEYVRADRIKALTEQLAAARQDAKAAEDELEMQEQEACMMENDYIKLEEERDALEVKLALMTTERDEAWKRAAHSEKMWGEAEVKLAKAVEAGQTMDDGCDCERCNKARATLAELKGESHDPL